MIALWSTALVTIHLGAYTILFLFRLLSSFAMHSVFNVSFISKIQLSLLAHLLICILEIISSWIACKN